MKNIKICDITMQSDNLDLSFREKIELSKLLDRLEASVIALPPIKQPTVDLLLVKSICTAVKHSSVSVPVGLDIAQADAVLAALSQAVSPRISVTVPLSAVQIEYVCRKKPDEIIDAISQVVAHCAKSGAEIEFVGQDATRADLPFVARAIQAAISAGASTVTVCDSAGAMLPDAFGSFVAELCAAAPSLSSVAFGVLCHSELGMADACAVAALSQGVTEIKAAASPQNCPSLSVISAVIAAKGSGLGVKCSVNTTEMSRLLSGIHRLCSPMRQSGTPESSTQNRTDDEQGILTASDCADSVTKAVQSLGFELNEEDNARVYDAFVRLAADKQSISRRELEAIVDTVAMQVPPTYSVDSYIITTSNLISATAQVQLKKVGCDDNLSGFSAGAGPINAAFLAVESIVQSHYELEDFQIRAITEGREAMGETIVRLRSGGKLYSGRGLSTDIVGASIRAYVNALNKIVYEEGQS